MSARKILNNIVGLKNTVEPAKVETTETNERTADTQTIASTTNTGATVNVAAKAAGGYTTVTQQEKQAIIQILNQARRSTKVPAANMKEVVWDDKLYTALQSYVAKVGPDWFFSNSMGILEPVPGLPDRHHGYNGYFLMRLPEFASFAKEGYDEFFHDTFDRKQMGIANIFKYRANQDFCYDYNNCDPTNFNNFVTCRNEKYPLELKPSTQCSWFFYYYGKMVIADVDSIACIPLGVPGPNTPSGQANSFWCYAKYKTPSSDKGYIEGTPGSECQPETPKCNNKLCIA